MNKLISNYKRSFGRSHGKISVRHIFSGHKKTKKNIEFNRRNIILNFKILKFDYDSFRNARLALIGCSDGFKTYILRNQNMKINDTLCHNNKNVDIIDGNSTLIKNIPNGTIISCVENKPKQGACFARASGSYCELLTKNDKFAMIKLSSNIKKKISINCIATIGKIYSIEKKKKYKAGQNVWQGIRPTIRGVAMNPVDHPHGGGEGKTSGGRHPTTPWGKNTKGKKTRKKCQDL